MENNFAIQNVIAERRSIRWEQKLQLGSYICEAIQLQTTCWSFSANYYDWPRNWSCTLPWLLAGLFAIPWYLHILLFIGQIANVQASFMIPGEVSSKGIWNWAWSICVLLWMQEQQDGMHHSTRLTIHITEKMLTVGCFWHNYNFAGLHLWGWAQQFPWARSIIWAGSCLLTAGAY
jgi:hypothetical protein